MSGRVLVAGVGNVFWRDDGFGVEVARALQGETLPDGVEVADVGIRGVHLAYQLLDGYDELLLVDASPRGEAPGTLYVLEPTGLEPTGPEPTGPEAPDDAAAGTPVVDAHSMGPDAVLATVAALTPRLGGRLPYVRVVACEPAEVTDGMGLTPPVAAAVPQAVRLVKKLLRGEALSTEAVSREPSTEGGGDGSPGEAGGPRRAGGAGRDIAAGHQAVPQDQPDVTTRAV